jgi:hypothetical protein
MHQGSVILDGVISYLAARSAGTDDGDGCKIRRGPRLTLVPRGVASRGSWRTKGPLSLGS